MKYHSEMVIENVEISKGIYKLTVGGCNKALPGQFYLLRAWETEPVLSRPVSVHEVNENSIVFIYQIVGRGTEILKKLCKGDSIKLTGPLGNGFPIPASKKKTAVITGGIGLAPILELVKNLKHCEVDLYCGFREKSFLLEEIKDYTSSITVATESGAEGHKGYVTDAFEPDRYDEVFCCGPEPMMRIVVEKCNEKAVPVWISSEKHMACGIGACLVCTCATKNGNMRACKDGPVFSGNELLF